MRVGLGSSAADTESRKQGCKNLRTFYNLGNFSMTICSDLTFEFFLKLKHHKTLTVIWNGFTVIIELSGMTNGLTLTWHIIVIFYIQYDLVWPKFPIDFQARNLNVSGNRMPGSKMFTLFQKGQNMWWPNQHQSFS